MSLRLSLLALLALGACSDAPSADAPGGGETVARVGDARLTEGGVVNALGDGPVGLDSVTAREQIIEQWVQRELLVQEARRQGLPDDPRVRRRLADAERATLEMAALAAFFDQAPSAPSEADLQAYYDRHSEALALREPYVRLRHLRLAAPTRATEARASLDRAIASPFPDSLFALVAREYADDPDGAIAFANEYVSEARLAALDETLGERVAGLSAGGQGTAIPIGPTMHLVQVIDRVPAGTVPPFRLVRDELAERLGIQMRRDAEARLIQRLRSEAQAAGRLDVP